MNVDQHVLNQQDQAESWDLTRRTSADDNRTWRGYGTRAARITAGVAARAEQAWMDTRARLGDVQRARRLEERAALGQRAQRGMDLENQIRWPWWEHRGEVIRRRAFHAQARATNRICRRLEQRAGREVDGLER